MLEIGKYNTLVVTDSNPVGLSLAQSLEDSVDTVLLPSSELSNDPDEHPSIGTQLKVFIYYAQTGDLHASLLKVPLQVDEFAVLNASGSSDVGAFFNWKLPRDLMVPKGLQHKPLDAGLNYVVRLIHDQERQKLIGTTKLHRYLIENGEEFSQGQEVEVLVFDRTDLGYKAIVNGTHQGLFFHSDLFRKLKIGESFKAFIQQIREDGKINLGLQAQGKKAIKGLAEQILEDLEAHGGLSTLTDKSDAKEIQARFQVSKNAYKKAIGSLYRNKLIKIEKTHLSLVKK